MGPAFTEKVVVVTGAASGIGRALALAFARAGARLHLADIDAEQLQIVAAEIRAHNAPCTAHRIDCAQPDQMEQLAQSTFSAEGRVDVLINNAGVLVGGPAHRVPLADWQWVMEVNFWSAVHSVHSFVPKMIEQGGGQLVNIVSIAGLFGYPLIAPYSASKFAVIGLCESLDAELGHLGIRVTAICPGAVQTKVLSNSRLQLPQTLVQRLTHLLEHRAKPPEKVAAQILKAVAKKKSLWVAPLIRPLWWFKRFWPSLYRWIARRLSSRALKRLSSRANTSSKTSSV